VWSNSADGRKRPFTPETRERINLFVCDLTRRPGAAGLPAIIWRVTHARRDMQSKRNQKLTDQATAAAFHCQLLQLLFFFFDRG